MKVEAGAAKTAKPSMAAGQHKASWQLGHPAKVPVAARPPETSKSSKSNKTQTKTNKSESRGIENRKSKSGSPAGSQATRNQKTAKARTQKPVLGTK